MNLSNFYAKNNQKRNNEEKKEFVYVSLKYSTFIVSNNKYKIEPTGCTTSQEIISWYWIW